VFRLLLLNDFEMRILINPSPADIAQAMLRPGDEQAAARRNTVAALLAEIRAEGDTAVRRLAERFDGSAPEMLEVDAAQFEAAERSLSAELNPAGLPQHPRFP
jgi:histidinol dehydrogenase